MALKDEIARLAAQLVVDDGMEYGPAKHKAVKQLRLGRVAAPELPDNDTIEAEVRDYLAELDDPAHVKALADLRSAALALMQWLEDFTPYVSGAVWRGTATANSEIHLQLYTDDSKAVAMFLASHNVDYGVSSRAASAKSGRREDIEVLSFTIPAKLAPGYAVAHLSVFTALDERGALKASANGSALRGTLKQLSLLVKADAA